MSKELNKGWNHVWVNDHRDLKHDVGRVWVLYGTQDWCSHCDWIVPGTFDIYS